MVSVAISALRWTPDSLAGGWKWVLISLHLLGGFILVALGIVGEYVGRIYEQVKERPIYVLKHNSYETPGRSIASQSDRSLAA